MFPILNPPPSSLPIPSLWVVPVHQPQASSIVHWTWTGNSFHTWYYTCFNAILPNLPTVSLSNRIHKTVLYISVSLAVRGMWGVGSMTRAQTHTSCIGRWSLDDWTAREVPDPVFKSHRTLCLAPLLKKTPVTSFYWGNSCVKLLLLFCEALGLEHQLWELCCSWQYVLLYKGNLTWTPNWS